MKKVQEYNNYENTTIEKIWLNELLEFKNNYIKCMNESNEKTNNIEDEKNMKLKKRITKKK